MENKELINDINNNVNEYIRDIKENIDETAIGLKGSPTRVKKSYTPEHKKSGEIYNDEDASVSVDKLINALSDEKLI